MKYSLNKLQAFTGFILAGNNIGKTKKQRKERTSPGRIVVFLKLPQL